MSSWKLAVFPDKKAMGACWRKGAPNEVGGLRVGYTLASYQGTAETEEPGCVVSDRPVSLAQQAAVGLQLR